MSARSLALLGVVCCALTGCAASSNDTGGVFDSGAADASLDVADTASTIDTTSTIDTATGTDTTVDARTDAPRDVIGDASCRLHKVYSSKNATCNACAQATCCETLNTCFDDPRCDDEYVNCILACALLPDDAGGDTGGALRDCLADCATKHPAGKSEYDAAIACVEGACVAECK
jgi:hypothetical protein